MKFVDRRCVVVLLALLLGCADDPSGGPDGSAIGDDDTDAAVGRIDAGDGPAHPMPRDAGGSSMDTPPDASWGDGAVDWQDAGLDESDGGVPGPGACPDDPCFLEQAAETGLRDVVGYGRGAAFVDVDSDGFEDLFVADTDNRFRDGDWGVSAFYRNRGDGTFERIDWGLTDSDLHGTWVGAFADYDNDGDPDVLIGNGGYTMESTLVFYENRVATDGVFVDRTVASGLGALAAGLYTWWGASWADIDGDGLLDAVATRRRGEALVLHNEGNGTFVDATAALGVGLSVDEGDDMKNPVFFDYDGDGDPDLYLAGMHSHGLFENRGVDGFVDITAAAFGGAVPADRPYVFAAVAADFDQDGRDDLYLGRWDHQDILMHNVGDGAFEALDTEIGLVTSLTDYQVAAPYENTMGLGVGDFFDDGFPDLVLGTGNPPRASHDIMFCNDGTAHFTRCSELFDDPAGEHFHTRAHGIVFADFDHDGDTDFFRNLGGHPNHDEANPGEDTRESNKLHVRQAIAPSTAALLLEGVVSNRDAVGARVTVRGRALRHYRVRSTQGFQSQNGRALTVSLTGAGQAQVTVAWPSGMTTELDVSRGQRLRVREGVGVVP